MMGGNGTRTDDVVFAQSAARELNRLGLRTRIVNSANARTVELAVEGAQESIKNFLSACAACHAESQREWEAFRAGTEECMTDPASTAGRLVATSAFKVGFGYRVVMPVATYFTWHGTNLEGRGLQPTIEEPFSFEASMHGRDNQLERAMQAVRETTASVSVPS